MEAGAELPTEGPLVRGLICDIDPEKSDLDAAFTRPTDGLLSMDFTSRTPGRWLTLSLSLGGESLADYGVVGFACTSTAPHSVDCRVSLRSGQEGGFHDLFFDRRMVSFPTESLHVDALRIADHPELQTETRWRNLMFHFDPRSFRLVLGDLRIFVA
ncbi:hypothetical protein AVJ23_19985 [Pseudoponticoccus marisrubri]|uniref:NADH:ubiquinone oxidoreductase intermediate-associated protein 30 domain-containing protein n=2 Tax=Pseudoponticoccus marisrubri TaxID=1685382 RepID=A0A0W7WE94_9RHOB|nr:hypothetical protein AVJ23_19985 [Pseudoponticoccus marisrubri]